MEREKEGEETASRFGRIDGWGISIIYQGSLSIVATKEHLSWIVF